MGRCVGSPTGTGCLSWLYAREAPRKEGSGGGGGAPRGVTARRGQRGPLEGEGDGGVAGPVWAEPGSRPPSLIGHTCWRENISLAL